MEENKDAVLIVHGGWLPSWCETRVMKKLPIVPVEGPSAVLAFGAWILSNWDNLPDQIVTCDSMQETPDAVMHAILEKRLYEIKIASQGRIVPIGWRKGIERASPLLQLSEMPLMSGPPIVRNGIKKSALGLDYSNAPYSVAWNYLFPNTKLPGDTVIEVSKGNVYRIAKTHLEGIGREPIAAFNEWARHTDHAEGVMAPILFAAMLRFKPQKSTAPVITGPGPVVGGPAIVVGGPVAAVDAIPSIGKDLFNAPPVRIDPTEPNRAMLSPPNVRKADFTAHPDKPVATEPGSV